MRFVLALLSSLGLASSAVAQERIGFSSNDGTVITGELYKPSGTAPMAAIVGLHGCSGMYRDGKPLSQISAWAKAFNDAGFVFLAVDSFGPRGLKSVCSPSDGELRGAVRAQDGFGAAKWLATQAYVNKARIGLIGWSHGGNAALAAATITPRPSVEIASVIAFYPPCKVYIDLKARPKVKLAIMHGASDNWTPVGPCEEFARLHNIDFVSYPGAYHNFDWPGLRMTVLRGVGPSGSAVIATNEPAREAAMAKTLAIFKAM
ncbi:MAG: dienelactone hydrolase family protein [Alphaproteobacteria bacterium]